MTREAVVTVQASLRKAAQAKSVATFHAQASIHLRRPGSITAVKGCA